MILKKINFLIFFLIIVNICNGKEVTYTDSDQEFYFYYDNENIDIISNKGDKKNKKFTLGIGKYSLNFFDTESRIGNVQKMILDKEHMINSGEYTPNDFDLESKYLLFYKVIKINGRNLLYKIYLHHDNGWLNDKKCIYRLVGTIEFFIDGKYYDISLIYDAENLYNAFMNKSKKNFSNYFSEYIEGCGLVLKDEKNGIDLFNAITDKNKQLPDDLFLWYDNFLFILNHVKIGQNIQESNK